MNLEQQAEKVEAEIKKLEEMGGTVTGTFTKFRNSAFARFPVLFVLLSTFGLVATLYGFEKVIDRIPLFEEHPLLLLMTGVVTLIATGALYKKLR